ncbi:MAG TPA: 3-dehydroquinate synthase, partial [Spirochaetota bacterium]|nr:3-dehydroquinate synthase [Spirochaetota bacterium]
KKKVIDKDEKEKAYRKILNFGHTAGHAVELLSKYRLSHGEAVAIGMHMELELAERLGVISAEEKKKARLLIAAYQLPLKPPRGSKPKKIYNAMLLDKKNRNRQIYMSFIKKIGTVDRNKGRFCRQVPEKIIINFLQNYKRK